jgi:hypothetical protein
MHLKLEHRKLRNETYLFKHESNQLLENKLSFEKLNYVKLQKPNHTHWCKISNV